MLFGNAAIYAACNSLLNNFSRMAFALSFVISSLPAARFKVLTLNSTASLQRFTLPCLSLNKAVSFLASCWLSFSYGVSKSIILIYFSVDDFVICFVAYVKVHVLYKPPN